ncbi:hypothetical protein QA640_02625 [Bradyrhizobium sp. CB82]|uniref:hypothetical protein n=1 Tax=Bradyrhizobium sp. CB82 TaxID=3039159 RepID=UPI0024B0CD37|nr:hypothetical protein [Bradyrhizobium sp. CB82]WFU41444.1 hypothetical protein QA640_02625 [Bradyrhizobium sp. CB82]
MRVKAKDGLDLISPPIGWTGVVRFIHITPRAFLPMRSMSAVTLIAGKGIEGDRYMTGEGFYSHLRNAGEQVTLFEFETLIALRRDAGVEFAPRLIHPHSKNQLQRNQTLTTSGLGRFGPVWPDFGCFFRPTPRPRFRNLNVPGYHLT